MKSADLRRGWKPRPFKASRNADSLPPFSRAQHPSLFLLRTAIFLVVLSPVAAIAVDHPEIPNGSECLSCHGEKAKGQAVHFDFANACNVCHVVHVADGRTSITLILPKEKICYSCHEKAAIDQVPYMKGECISCHDPHSSARPYLNVLRSPNRGKASRQEFSTLASAWCPHKREEPSRRTAL